MNSCKKTISTDTTETSNPHQRHTLDAAVENAGSYTVQYFIGAEAEYADNDWETAGAADATFDGTTITVADFTLAGNVTGTNSFWVKVIANPVDNDTHTSSDASEVYTNVPETKTKLTAPDISADADNDLAINHRNDCQS